MLPTSQQPETGKKRRELSAAAKKRAWQKKKLKESARRAAKRQHLEHEQQLPQQQRRLQQQHQGAEPKLSKGFEAATKRAREETENLSRRKRRRKQSQSSKQNQNQMPQLPQKAQVIEAQAASQAVQQTVASPRLAALGTKSPSQRASPRLQALAAAKAAATIPEISLELSVDSSAGAAASAASSPLPAFAPPQWHLDYKVDELERRLQPLLSEPAIGVDIEWRPTFVAGKPPNPVALLQLSSLHHCVLLPIKHLRALPPSLGQLLSSPRIWKLGCGIEEDAKKILADLGLPCSPVLEIGDVACMLQLEDGVAFPSLATGEEVKPGLRALCLACGYDLQKPKKLSRSNWEARGLTQQQQRYAALDAYAGIWIARCLHALHSSRTRSAATPSPLLPWLGAQGDRLDAFRGRRKLEAKERRQERQKEKRKAKAQAAGR